MAPTRCDAVASAAKPLVAAATSPTATNTHAVYSSCALPNRWYPTAHTLHTAVPRPAPWYCAEGTRTKSTSPTLLLLAL